MKNQRRFLSALVSCVIFSAVAGIAFANPTLLAGTPPMGWNSWNHFADKVSDAVVRAQADAMVSSGLRDAGYVYINIDDTWQGKRDAQGVIHANEKFVRLSGKSEQVTGLTHRPSRKSCNCPSIHPPVPLLTKIRVLSRAATSAVCVPLKGQDDRYSG